MIEADGWYLVRVKGSHHQFKHNEKGLVTVKHPQKDIPLPTLKSIKTGGALSPYWRFTCCTLLLLIKAIHPSAFAYLIFWLFLWR